VEVNYFDIGSRIKTQRLKLKITQEKLAELTELSISHMSSIENGKTKLGLPTVIKIANALEVSVDELLCGSLMRGKQVIQNEFTELLSDCSPEESGIILDTVNALKRSLRVKNRENS